jgi:hypothetical protein
MLGSGQCSRNMGDGPINVAASGKRKTRKKLWVHPDYIIEARIGGTYPLMKEY